MKLSLDWISDFVDLAGVDPRTLAERVTLGTAEVDGIEELSWSVDGVVAGLVVAADGDGVAVDVGGDAPVRATALPGGTSGSVVLIATRGDDAPRLCTQEELGLGISTTDAARLPGSTAPGTPLGSLVPATDVLLEIDNKSLTNRPDLWGHYGFAREIAALLDRPLKKFEVADLTQFDDLPALGVRIDRPEHCRTYTALGLDLDGSATAPSAARMQRRLAAVGQRLGGVAVDVTNYVMLELGQPLHAFDQAQLGETITVASAGDRKVFRTLDGQDRRLEPDDLLILAGNEPVALAGIMGGEGSMVVDDTRQVVLESANFDGVRVRRTATRLGLRTDAGQRFEKNQPAHHAALASARVVRLLRDQRPGLRVTSRFSVAGDPSPLAREIVLDEGYFSDAAGVEVPDEDVDRILTGLGFGVSRSDGRLHVAVPPHRVPQDVSLAVDLLEEVLRVWGYGRVTPVPPRASLTPVVVNHAVAQHHKLRRVFAASHRFNEVHTYSWYDDEWLRALGHEPIDTLRLRNPARKPESRLRTALLPNLLACVARNRVHDENVRVFELGRVYRRDGESGSVQGARLAGAIYSARGPEARTDVYRELRGVLEDAALVLGIGGFDFVRAGTPAASWENPEATAEIRVGDVVVGRIGVLTRNFTVAGDGIVGWFEIDLEHEALKGTLYPDVTFVPAPDHPGSWQDFSVVWNRGDFAGARERIDGFRHELLTGSHFLYVYAGKSMQDDRASYTFRFHLAAAGRTLTGADLDGFRDAFKAHLTTVGLSLR